MRPVQRDVGLVRLSIETRTTAPTAVEGAWPSSLPRRGPALRAASTHSIAGESAAAPPISCSARASRDVRRVEAGRSAVFVAAGARARAPSRRRRCP